MSKILIDNKDLRPLSLRIFKVIKRGPWVSLSEKVLLNFLSNIAYLGVCLMAIHAIS
jgi:hypothetical protein